MNGKEYNLNQAQHYLTLLDESAEKFVFRTFDDNKERKDKSLARIFIGTIEQHHAALVALNKKGAGVFVNVQETDLKGGRRENVTGIRCIYHELDNAAIKQDPIEPSFIVQSSKGKVHKYWLCEGVKKDYDFAGIIRRCVQDYGSDENAQDISRVLRVAGFYHMKNAKKPQLVSVIHESGGLPYSREQILKAFPPLDVIKKDGKEGKNNNKNNKKIISVNQSVIDDLQNALLFINSDSREVWIGVGHALKELGEVGLGLWIGWSAKSASFDHKDALEKWSGFHTNNTGYQAIFKRAYASGWRSKVPKEQPKQEAQEWNDSISDEIDYIIPFDCVARDIQQAILNSSRQPQPALSYIAALSVVSACIGRNICVDENIKGNLMCVGIAESGEGKDHPLKYAKSIMDAVGLGKNIESELSSGAAFIDILVENPSPLFCIDEFGHFLEGVAGRGANTFAKEIVQMLTKLYTSADDKEFLCKRRKGIEGARIEEPNITLLGLSTERQVFDTFSSNAVADGSLARYFIVFGRNNTRMIEARQSAKVMPEKLITRLKDLIDKYKPANEVFLSSKTIHMSDAFRARKKHYEEEINNNMRLTLPESKKHFKSHVARIVVRAVQQAMLINPECDNPDVLDFTIKKELEGYAIFTKKFTHLSSDNETERLTKLLESKIKEAGKKGISAMVLTQKTRQINTLTRKMLIDELVEVGAVFVESRRMGKSKRETTFYFWRK